jgi:hypothetical protein
VGKIDVVLHVGTAQRAMAACHVEALSGVHVSHNLVVECIVLEEMYHPAVGSAKKGGGQYQRTGNARVLRMTFPVIVTERGGMGISWDEEIPPRYEDVAWNAPPTFAQSESSADAEHRDSMDEIEALEGIRRPRSGSPAVISQRPEISQSSCGHRLAEPTAIRVLPALEAVKILYICTLSFRILSLLKKCHWLDKSDQESG